MNIKQVDVFRNLRLAQRLAIGFGVVIVLVLAACGVVGSGLADLQRQADASVLAQAQVLQRLDAGQLDAVRELLQAGGRQAEQVAATARWSFWALLALAGLAVVAGSFSAWRVSTSVAAPMEEAVAAARRVSDGNLMPVELTRRDDEVGRLLQELDAMRGHLGSLVGQVRGHAEAVADSSRQIAQGNQDLSERTERQAASLQQTASAIEDLTATVGRNAADASEARDLAAGASEVARRGGAVVGSVVHTMTDIHAASRRIADIVGVIDGIAFQTSILALNAAVEAARAGDQGRGFAVVAAEVRSLAQRSAVAAREIKALIAASVEKVDAGTRQVDAAGRTMGEIVASVQSVSERVTRIAGASQAQQAGIVQVNQAVTQMEQAVQQNAAMVEQAAASTDALQERAGTLFGMVSRFRLAEALAPRSLAP